HVLWLQSALLRKERIAASVRAGRQPIAMLLAQFRQRGERGPVIPAARVLLVAVEGRIVRHGDRLDPQRRIVFDADHGWRDPYQGFQEPVIVAVDVDRENADFRKPIANEIEIVESKELLDDVDAGWPKRACVVNLPFVAVNEQP